METPSGMCPLPDELCDAERAKSGEGGGDDSELMVCVVVAVGVRRVSGGRKLKGRRWAQVGKRSLTGVSPRHAVTGAPVALFLSC